MTAGADDSTAPANGNVRPDLPPAAVRALAEAAARRQAATDAASDATTHAREVQGRGGADPVRFGDWEVKGLATDF